MHKFLGILVAAIFVFGIAIFEAIISHSYLTKTHDFASEIYAEATETNFYQEEMINKIDTLRSNWEYRVKVLSYFINHTSIAELGEKITIAQTSIDTQDFTTFKESIDLIVYYASAYEKLFGANPQNIV